MKAFVLILLSVGLLVAPGHATSVLPPAPPKITIENAISYARRYLADRGRGGYYIAEAKYGYYNEGEMRIWLISVADPNAGYTFLGVWPEIGRVAEMRPSPNHDGKWVEIKDEVNLQSQPKHGEDQR